MGSVGRGVRRGGTPCAAAPPPVKVSPHGARGKGAALLRRRGTGSAPAARREGNRTTRRAEGESGTARGDAAPTDGGRDGLRGRVD